MRRRFLYIILTVLCLMVLSTAPCRAKVMLVGVADTADDITADQILSEAKKHLGKPYRYGGKGPSSFDCAGFVRYVYGRFGIGLAPSCTPQYLSGRAVQTSDLEPGDLVFFGGRKASRSIGHVGIVTSVDPLSGSFEFVHAARTGVRYSHSDEPYYRMRYLCACRILRGGNSSGLPAFAEETALDLYFPDTNAVFSYLAGQSVEDWIRAQGKSSEWISLMPADTVHLVVGDLQPHFNDEELCQWRIADQGDVALGNCHFAYDVHCQWDGLHDTVHNLLHNLREASDIVVVTFVSSDDDIGEAQDFARLCIDLGADVVCCYGATSYHRVEYYEGRLILYNLGSSVALKGHQSKGTSTLVEVRLLDDGTLQGGRVTSKVKEMPSAAGDIQIEFDGSFNAR